MIEHGFEGDLEHLSAMGDTRRRLLAAGLAGLTTVIQPAHADEVQPGADSTALVKRYFPGFRQTVIPTSGTSIHTLIGGNGPALLLLHGYPENLMTWRRVAPLLARHFTVVVTDLRGYGDSGKPVGGDNHVNYSKRAMALDQIEVMQSLGFKQFVVVGHDRGARVAQQLARDYPDRVSKAMLLDIVPSDYVYRTIDRRVATAYFHWFFLIQPAPLPETLIQRSGDAFIQQLMGSLVPSVIEPDVFADYQRCVRNPLTLRAICEDYRAGATIDQVNAGAGDAKISVPIRVLWGEKGLVGTRYEPLTVWKDYAEQLSGRPLSCNHWLPEEMPEQIVAEIQGFAA